jgi:DNA-binding transcriptional ArsR family regulator
MNTELHSLASQQAHLCSVFGNAKRILILWVLGKEELSVGEIAENINTSLQNTSQHLRLMKDRDIVQSRRVGQTVYYRIAENDLMKRCSTLLNLPFSETGLKRE